MSLRHLSSRIELNIWHILIGLLSDSQHLRKSIRWFYLDFGPALTIAAQKIEPKRLIFWAIVGLGTGLITGLLFSIY